MGVACLARTRRPSTRRAWVPRGPPPSGQVKDSHLGKISTLGHDIDIKFGNYTCTRAGICTVRIYIPSALEARAHEGGPKPYLIRAAIPGAHSCVHPSLRSSGLHAITIIISPHLPRRACGIPQVSPRAGLLSGCAAPARGSLALEAQQRSLPRGTRPPPQHGGTSSRRHWSQHEQGVRRRRWPPAAPRRIGPTSRTPPRCRPMCGSSSWIVRSRAGARACVPPLSLSPHAFVKGVTSSASHFFTVKRNVVPPTFYLPRSLSLYRALPPSLFLPRLPLSPPPPPLLHFAPPLSTPVSFARRGCTAKPLPLLPAAFKVQSHAPLSVPQMSSTLFWLFFSFLTQGRRVARMRLLGRRGRGPGEQVAPRRARRARRTCAGAGLWRLRRNGGPRRRCASGPPPLPS